LQKRHIVSIRVAARFFSGVPHPHLLGVCRPDFFTAKMTGLEIPKQNLTLALGSFNLRVPLAGV